MDPGAAAPARPEVGPPSVREVATLLAVLGCAAAVFALFAMMLEPADFHVLGGNCAAMTVAEVADLRAGAALLLLSSASQALAAVWARCVPSRVLALLAIVLAAVTVYRVAFVVPAVVIAAAGQPACHGQGAIAVQYLLFVALMCVPLLGAVAVAFLGDYY